MVRHERAGKTEILHEIDNKLVWRKINLDNSSRARSCLISIVHYKKPCSIL